MRRIVSLFAVTGLLALSLSGCFSDKCEQTLTYYSYAPVYKGLDEIRQAVKVSASQELRQPGKMYFKDGYIFISEINKGIHVIDNTNPAQPQSLAFIEVPGNHDIAAKGNILYADSYLDLVAIDISNPTQAAEVGRELNVFPYGVWHEGLWADPDSGIAIDWIETEITDQFNCSDGFTLPGLTRNMFTQDDLMLTSAPQASSNSQFGGGRAEMANTSGVGGSMARFTILGDYLYSVTYSDMIIFSLANATDPAEANRINVGWDIETIFPRGNTLFLGSMTGMHIYSASNPTNPQWLSSVQHVQSCDPVVADEEFAYVTLRDGNDCGGTVNQLLVFDLQSLTNPALLHTYEFFNPHGLGISGETLFICDGDEGLKIYDATDVSAITSNPLAAFPDIHAFDVIPLGNVLLTIGEDGFYQYDYSDLTDIKLLSMIPVAK